MARINLDLLRARTSRHEEPLGTRLPDPTDRPQNGSDPEHEALLAEGVGLALLVVLDTLTPAERLAFVLHDMFAVPFDQIAAILGRSPNAAKMLASRARRRVQGTAAVPDTDPSRERAVVEAFLAARAAATSRPWWRCWIPRWCSEPTTPPWPWAPSGRSAGSSGGRYLLGAGPLHPTGTRRRRRRSRVGAGGRPRVVFAFTIGAGRSWRSTCWPTPSACAGSTWRSWTTEGPNRATARGSRPDLLVRLSGACWLLQVYRPIVHPLGRLRAPTTARRWAGHPHSRPFMVDYLRGCRPTRPDPRTHGSSGGHAGVAVDHPPDPCGARDRFVDLHDRQP